MQQQYIIIVATSRERSGMEKKVGRPYAEKPKDFMFRMRMDGDTLEKLDKLCFKNKLSRSEMVRQLIDKAK